jgi:hypothetical protein
MTAKLYCSKVSHNPYKEEMITEITEKVFELDGYQIEESLLEGIPFTIYFNNDGVTDVKIEVAYYKNYFEDNFNTRWYQKVKEYAQNIIKSGDEVDVPQFIKDKYFKNGINVAYIVNE